MTPARRIATRLLLQEVACDVERVIPPDGELGAGVLVVTECEHVHSGEQAVGDLLNP
jgi:hypothetical protein